MNTPKKFRVWDVEQNKFLSSYADKGIEFYHEQGKDWHEKQVRDIVPVSWFLQDHNNNLENYIVTQYTGLNDKNNKEIYEGDIIKEHHFEDWGNDTVGYEYRGVVRYMTRHNYGFNDELKFSGFVTFPNLEENQKYIGNPLKTNCEVIGNICQHSELLK